LGQRNVQDKMHFTVTRSRYSPDRQRLSFSASGERNGVRFTIVTDVKCRDPKTAENTHLVALLKIQELFLRSAPSGR